MHQLSYESHNPKFRFAENEFSFQIFTFQNIYEPDIQKTVFCSNQSDCSISCFGLTWAGGQEKADGKLEVKIVRIKNRILISFFAEHSSESIRCIKVTIHDLKTGKIVNLRKPATESMEHEIQADGEIFRYPNGFEGLYTPLIVMKHEDGACSWFRSLDPVVRPKTFAVIPHENSFDVELIFEECARNFSKTIKVPEWEIGFNGVYDEIMEEQHQWIRKTYDLKSWSERNDVPEWAKKISLILSMHCEHWSGYVFNTYFDICSYIEKLSAITDMSRVLIYLPGWEGRYYYQYGDFRPEPRLGGADGFKKMIDLAHSVGAHVMPMFMINGANPHTEGFEIWGASSLYVNPSGYPQIWGSCDWDSSRHYDHNCGFPMNPGAPLWQDKLVGQVNHLIEEYDFDGVFMDLAAVYCNDRRFDTHQGALDIAKRIREGHPDILMAGEGWYDALSVSYPLTQPSLSENGDCRWSDRPYAPLFDECNRCFAHLGTGDPVRDSTGVFEFGYNSITNGVPFRKGIIPTITIVDDTIEKGWDVIKQRVIESEEYGNVFCKK